MVTPGFPGQVAQWPLWCCLHLEWAECGHLMLVFGCFCVGFGCMYKWYLRYIYIYTWRLHKNKEFPLLGWWFQVQGLSRELRTRLLWVFVGHGNWNPFNITESIQKIVSFHRIYRQKSYSSHSTENCKQAETNWHWKKVRSIGISRDVSYKGWRSTKKDGTRPQSLKGPKAQS